MDIDMIRVIRRNPRSPIVLVFPSGSLQPVCPRCSLGTPKTRFRSYGSACCTCSGTCQFLGEGKGRGKLANDKEESVTCHMGTQFCFRVYVSVF
ncbi:hypothetical protein E5676_scaffold458G00020 [Cucumis melo var. makuwa]|uniref:Uncharacterized protein n=1 Tax=Cucumis melo var. makuwa TaxID=1194695 RepID=A0A5D3CGT3_CUCMM|nr:hypothetical protein E5676_scaffold458G00020 [Cucumis melo var. makuwa]